MLILIGLATGALTGLTGASGMSILISALLLAGVEIRQVIGLTFAITLANAAISLGPYWKHGHVDRRSGALVGLPAIGAVLVGHVFSHRVEGGTLTGLMVVCLLLIGVKFLVSPRGREPVDSEATRRPSAGVLVLMGCVIGFVMGVMGGGGGVFIGAAFILLFKMDARSAIGTSILIMGLAAIPGVFSHWFSGTIDIYYATAILVSSLPAAFAASWFANRIPPAVVKRLLGTYLVIVAMVLAYRTFL
jgi:uncharacterized membrane protein YfcA